MNILNKSRAFLIASLIISCFAPSIATAQLDNNPQALNHKAVQAMQARDWNAALEHLNEAIESFDKNALILFGPQFGVTWYRKGICEMHLENWGEAVNAFKTCNEKYASIPDRERGGKNIFEKRALLYWGKAAQGAKDFKTALEKYYQFLEERDPVRDKFQPGSFYINLATCHFKLNQISDGLKHLETALENKERFRTPDAGIIGAFQALVETSIESGNDTAVLDLLQSNRADFIIDPYGMGQYSILFLSLAGQAYEAGMETLTVALYQLIPSTTVMLEDINSRFTRLGDRAGVLDGSSTIYKSKLRQAKENLTNMVTTGDPIEVVQLSATAFLHEKKGNVRGAYTAYHQLEKFYAESKKREDNLYNLARTASVLGKVSETREFGMRFLDAFPDSKYADSIRRMMLTSLFFNGEYLACIETATEILPSLKEGTKEHDIALHVLGGSYFYTGDYREAKPRIDKHVETYPESDYAQASLYFQASNEASLQFWTKAAKLLDAFLEKYPDPKENVYYDFALFDRANAHYTLEELEPALAKANRLEQEFPNSDVIDRAYNLKGNIFESQGDFEQAITYYAKALEIAESRGNALTAAESLNYLISLLGKEKDNQENLNKAVAYADQYWEKYGFNSPYKAQVAVGQMIPLKSVGRTEEAVETLRKVIVEMANEPSAAGLEEAITSYTEAYLENHTVEELKDHYYNFKGIASNNHAARALLRIAVIGVYEDLVEKAGDDENKLRNAQAAIRVLFQDLSQAFELKDLSNFILVKVGNFILNTNSPQEALPYFDQALNREDDNSYRFPALFGRAAALGKSGSREKQAEAIKDFKRIIQDAEDRSDKERALFQMIDTQLDMGAYEQAKENARLYLDAERRDENGGYSKRKPDVAMMLAEAYDKMNMTNDAISAYVNIYNTYPGDLRISAPAVKRAMELFWQRNQTSDKVSDKQGAYNLGRGYVDKTRAIIDSGQPTAEEVKMWKEVESLMKRYEANPDVKSKEQLQKEAENR